MTATAHQTWLQTLGGTGIVAASATILVAVLTASFTSNALRRRSRAERYAEMVATLAGWTELPFRIRRRQSDEASVLTPLIDRFHQLQERVVIDSAELAAECPWLATRYERALEQIRAGAAPYIIDAWATAPAPTLGGMNLKGWGPDGLNSVVTGWRGELRWRFGWRRLANPIRLTWQSFQADHAHLAQPRHSSPANTGSETGGEDATT